MKKLFYLIVLLILCSVGQSMAQSEQSFKPWVLQITEHGKTSNYVLSSFSYGISRISSDSIPIEKQFLYANINLTLNTPADDVMIKWMTDPAATVNGKILFKDKKTGNVLKEYTMEDAYITNTMESYYDGGYGESDTNLSLMVATKKFMIGNVPVKNLKLTQY